MQSNRAGGSIVMGGLQGPSGEAVAPLLTIPMLLGYYRAGLIILGVGSYW